jgi:hypothetical protein
MAGAARQPLLWLVIALTLAVVGASVWTVRTARGPLSVSPDPVQRIAQIQTTDDRSDRRALELDVRGELELGGAGLRLRSDSAAIVADAALQLAAIHATDASQDRRVELLPCGARLWCTDAVLPEARFRFEVSPADAAWRIVGARELGQDRVVLASVWSTR